MTSAPKKDSDQPARSDESLNCQHAETKGLSYLLSARAFLEGGPWKIALLYVSLEMLVRTPTKAIGPLG